MSGSLSTLGLGSGGVLSNDLIDQLREADNTARITPIERSQEELQLKQSGLDSIKSLVNELTDLSTSLSDISLYSATTSEVTGDAVTINADSGVKEQSMNIEVISLATNDIQQSDNYASKSDLLGAGNLTLDIDGESYDIEITDEDTLESLSKKIKDETDGKIEASILNIGGDNPYTMVLKSTETGESNNITASGDISFTRVGDGAKDATFKVDGIEATSSSNTVTDLIDGLDVTFEEIGSSKIDIKQDSQKITDDISNFVDKYNETIELISKLTSYDSENQVGAVLQGSSEIRGIRTQLSDVFSTTFASDGSSAKDFGIDSDKDGVITFDKDVFQEKIKESPDEVQNFFVGEDDKKGLFRNFNTELFNIGTSSSGPLKALKANYDDKEITLAESLDKAKQSLDNKYEIMQKKFAAYDAVIGKLQNSSDYLTSIIDADSKS